METTKNRFLESASGYAMPFAGDEEHDVLITLGYGEQTHPMTGEKFVHQGMDFAAVNVPLYALASGVVVGVGKDAVHEQYIIISYGGYEVKYGHIYESYVRYGQPVTAAQTVAMSGDFLHLGVRFEGEQIDPKDLLGLLYGNISQLEAMGIKQFSSLPNQDFPVKTDFDADKDEIQRLMFRWLPTYMMELGKGSYRPSGRLEQTLRNAFSMAQKDVFFDELPTIGNPLGLGSNAAPLISKVQNLLIADFLNYLALRRNVYLSSWSDEQKKSFLTSWQPMAT